mmetsp:Transcript_4162/g.8000  ORF Transcript_4162/g.8000 Transcript_4162/m.8000 type:complete len:220 (+) Transcript_4162:1094-1753(+)
MRCPHSMYHIHLNSDRLRSSLCFWYSGKRWYLANSSIHPSSVSGGRIPVGFHSTMDRPEPVSLVIPPRATIPNTIPAHPNNHQAIARLALASLCAASSSSRVISSSFASTPAPGAPFLPEIDGDAVERQRSPGRERAWRKRKRRRGLGRPRGAAGVTRAAAAAAAAEIILIFAWREGGGRGRCGEQRALPWRARAEGNLFDHIYLLVVLRSVRAARACG